MTYQIRLIEKRDNDALAKVIKTALEEQGNDIDGTVYTDEATNHMYDGYQAERSIYFIVEEDGELLGGSGIAGIKGEDAKYCELQRMFITAKARGKGIGAELMKKCLEFAKENDYEFVYIETLNNMEEAVKLYEKSGFKNIDYRLGNTGHFSCTVSMMKKL